MSFITAVGTMLLAASLIEFLDRACCMLECGLIAAFWSALLFNVLEIRCLKAHTFKGTGVGGAHQGTLDWNVFTTAVGHR